MSGPGRGAPFPGALGGAGALMVGAVVFIVCLLASPPTLWYLPLGRAFYVGAQPPELGMDFYGRCLVAWGAALLAALACHGLGRLLPERWARDGALLLWGFALIALWIAAGVMAGSLATRVIVPG